MGAIRTGAMNGFVLCLLIIFVRVGLATDVRDQERVVSETVSREELLQIYHKHYTVQRSAHFVEPCESNCPFREYNRVGSDVYLDIAKRYFWRNANFTDFERNMEQLQCEGVMDGAGIPNCAKLTPFPPIGRMVNVAVGREGVVFSCFSHKDGEEVKNGTLFEISGGCCQSLWAHYGHQGPVKIVLHGHVRRAIALIQHHGATMYHVINEVMLRFLGYYHFIISNPDLMVIVQGGHELPQAFLSSLGVSPDRILQVGTKSMLSVEDLYVPAPVIQKHWHYPQCSIISARDFLIELLSKVSEKQAVVRKRNKIILVKRGKGLDEEGRCYATRCMHDFEGLKTMITERMEGRGYEIVVFPPEGLFIGETVNMWHGEALYANIKSEYAHNAVAVIGIHGAAFTNSMFCAEGTEIIHIGSPEHRSPIGPYWYKKFCDQFGLNFHAMEALEPFKREYTNVMVDAKNITDLVDRLLPPLNAKKKTKSLSLLELFSSVLF